MLFQFWSKKPIYKTIKKQEEPPEGPSNADFRVFHRSADDHMPDMRNAFLDAVESTQDEIVLERVKEALRQGDFTRIEGLINWELFRTQFGSVSRSILLETLEQSGNNSINLLPNEVREGISFDVTNPRVDEWLANESGRLIRQIEDGTRFAIRNQLARANQQGLGIDTTASMVKDFIGLTDNQMRAVDNFRNRLIEDGVPLNDAIRRSLDQRNRLLEFRAENIARTETINAARQGAVELMNQGVEQQGFDQGDFVKVWIVTGDDRTCPICRPLHGQIVELNGLFDTSAGQLEGPTAHPQCRCAIAFERR